MSAQGAEHRVQITIDADEWHEVLRWLPFSLTTSEAIAAGHVLLDCEGTRRAWVVGDDVHTVVLHRSGPAPSGLVAPDQHFHVLVNSRFFRGRRPQDAVLEVESTEGGRVQTLVTDGVRTTLVEHPGGAFDWRSLVGATRRNSIVVRTDLLAEALSAAAAVPVGVDVSDEVHAWMSVRDGRLRFEAPWVDYPWTVVSCALESSTDDTVSFLVDVRRLKAVTQHLDTDTTELYLADEPLHPIGLRSGDVDVVVMPADRWCRERRALEELLCEFIRQDHVEPDHDGDYAIVTPEGHPMWVRLNPDAQPFTVQVFSVLASRVPATPALFEELNSINANAAHVKVLWAADAVMAEVDLVLSTMEIATLGNALELVRRATERYHGVLSAFFTEASEG
jgi:hypothetical protein